MGTMRSVHCYVHDHQKQHPAVQANSNGFNTIHSSSISFPSFFISSFIFLFFYTIII